MFRFMSFFIAGIFIATAANAQVSVNMDALNDIDLTATVPSESAPFVLRPPVSSQETIKLKAPAKTETKKPQPKKAEAKPAKVQKAVKKEPVVVEDIKSVNAPVEKVEIKEEKSVDKPVDNSIAIQEKVAETPAVKEEVPIKVEEVVPVVVEKPVDKAEDKPVSEPVQKEETRSIEPVKVEEPIKVEEAIAPKIEEKKPENPNIPAELNDGDIALTLIFDAEATILDTDKKEALAKAITPLVEDMSKSFRVLGYASDEANDESKSRRASLARAISVRSALIDMGIHSTRIELRALGDKSSDNNKNKVDILLIKR